eukprot:182204_1
MERFRGGVYYICVLWMAIAAGGPALAITSSPSSSSGYDQTLALFDEKGKIPQMAHVLVAVERNGGPLVAVQGKSCAVLACRRAEITKHNLVMDPQLHEIHENLWIGCTGVPGDINCLIRMAKDIALSHEHKRGYKIRRRLLARLLADRAQRSTQHASVRPLGVVVLLVGLNGLDEDILTDGALSRVDPTGLMYELYGSAAGCGSPSAMAILEKRLRHNEGSNHKGCHSNLLLPSDWIDCANIAVECLSESGIDEKFGPMDEDHVHMVLLKNGSAPRVCTSSEIRAILNGKNHTAPPVR